MGFLDNILGQNALEYLNGYQILGNTLELWLYAVLIFVGLYLGLYLVKTIILARLRALADKTENKFDDAFIDALLEIKWPFFFLVSLMAGIGYLSIAKWIDLTTFYLTLAVITFYAVKVIKVIIVHGARTLSTANGKDEEEHDDTIATVIATIIQLLIWVGIILFALSYAGIDVTTALAGVGIGGIAIAFALQNVLSDIFASFSIYFDKPFKKGHFIVIGTDSGVVQKIGIKSTRIKTLQGQELVVSNKELTETRVNNYKRMEKRRVVFTLGVTYSTTLAKMKKIPKMIDAIFKKVDNADLDRVHFKEYADSSMNFEIVYYVKAADYNTYMDIQQEVNLDIKQSFEKEKIDFAFPSTTVYLEK